MTHPAPDQAGSATTRGWPRPGTATLLPSKPLRSLQIGRGLAALFVVLFHLNNSVWGIAKYFPDPFSQALSFGNSGVHFFFVLSGFIIYLVHAEAAGVPGQFLRFAFKRLVRVYPTYWVVLASVVAALFLDPALGTRDQRDVSRIVASALLIPYPQEPIVSVAWTLEHELLFYAIFSISILNARIGKLLFVLWQVGCLGNTLFGSAEFPYRVVFSANNLLFSLGIAMAFLFRKWRCPAPGSIAIGGALAFIAVGLHEVYASAPLPADAYILAFGTSSAAAILGACSYERQHGLRAPRLLDALGDASYSIYLVHLPLLSLFAKALFASGLAALLPQTMSLLVMLCGLVAAGLIFSKAVEMPLIAELGRVKRQRTPPTPEIPARK